MNVKNMTGREVLGCYTTVLYYNGTKNMKPDGYADFYEDELIARIEAGERALEAMNKLVAIYIKEFATIMALEDYEEIIMEYMGDK